jgi:redox-sensitive bicupin YhaK (pirin superfamily)
MSVQLSPVIALQARGNGGTFSVKSIDLRELGRRASPVVVFDDFRVRGKPFGPHPHAGFSAVTYVLEDSPGRLRSRYSLGNDIVVGPGGIVWTQAGSGVIHEEMPADSDLELHGVQIFVNLSARNKLSAPQVFWLESGEVPEWRGEAGDRVRVVVGSYEGVISPLVPIEPFVLFDVELQHAITFHLPSGHNALIHVREGKTTISAPGGDQELASEHAIALYGASADVQFRAQEPSRLLVLSGAEIREPVLVHGSFIMSEASQIEAAIERYRTGKMGHLAPISEK